MGSSILKGARERKEAKESKPVALKQPVTNPDAVKVGSIADKQDKLIDLIILNPTKSKAQLAIKAGYNAKDVEKQMNKIWKGKQFQQRLAARQAVIAERNNVSLDKVAGQYARIAFLDPREYYEFTETGGIKMKSSDMMDLTTVCKISETKTGVEPMAKFNVKIEFHDKMEALKGLRDMFGYDKPAKHAHLIAGDGQGLTSEGLEAAIAGLISGTAPSTPNEGVG